MRAQRAPLRPTVSPARLCRVVYAGFWRSDGDYPCVGQQISRRDNARRLSPSDLRTTLPDLCALAKRPLASPHRAEDLPLSPPKAASETGRPTQLSVPITEALPSASQPPHKGESIPEDSLIGNASGILRIQIVRQPLSTRL